MNYSSSYIRTLLALLCLTASAELLGCGGGSIGTGTGEGLTTVEGRLVSPEGLPLPGFSVTIEGSETPAVTDQTGYFVLAVPTDTLPESVEIHVSPDGTNLSNVTVGEVASDPSAVVLEVVVDEVAPPVVVKSTNLTVQAIGDCAASFNNNRSIDQIAQITEGTSCDFSVEVTSDGVLRSDAKYRIETRACDNSAEWKPIQEGITTSESSATLGIASIIYTVDPEHCVYRVVAPIGEEAVESASFEIRTLLKLDYDGQQTEPLPPSMVEPEPTTTPTPDPTPEVLPMDDLPIDPAGETSTKTASTKTTVKH